MKVSRYSHLCLTDWPFRVVPEESFCTFLADRGQLRTDLMSLLTHLSRRDASSMHLMWAYYGAGKTHSLRYLSHVAENDYRGLIPIYNEFPKGLRSFLDLHRSFMAGLSLDCVRDAYLEVFTSPKKGEVEKALLQDFPDLANALKVLCMGNEDQQSTTVLWLRGDSVALRDLRDIGISARIDRAEQALRVLTWVIRLLQRSGSDRSQEGLTRIIWMIDEFQRLSACRKHLQEEINGCLQSLFNRCPRSLTMVLSFSGPPGTKVPTWLSKELADRIGLERRILLPPLNPSEAEEFVRDVLRHFRDNGMDPPVETFPFSSDAIAAGIGIVRQKTELKPRTIMQAFNAVLEEADAALESGTLRLIGPEYVRKILSDRALLETESEEVEQ